MPRNNRDISRRILSGIERLTQVMTENFAALQSKQDSSLAEHTHSVFVRMLDRLSRLTEMRQKAENEGADKTYIDQLSNLIDGMTKSIDEINFKLKYIASTKDISRTQRELEQEKSKSDNERDSNKIAALEESLAHQLSGRQEIVDKYKGIHNNPDEIRKIDAFINGLQDEEAIFQEIVELDREHLLNTRALERAQLAYNTRLEESSKRWGVVKSSIMETIGQVMKGGNLWMKYNAQAISDAKRLGMTSKQEALGYMESLMENSKTLSRNFGMTAEQAMKMQDVYAKVTGRATLLTRSQMEDIAASSKLMGEETVQSAIQIMDTMGSTSQSTTEFLDRNFARAVNSGLDTVKASEEFVKNLSLANKLTFKNGVDGISKMTILSQTIKMNLQEVANVADKFSSIEGAIEGSAKLQMLGGPVAMYGGNPMQMLYESLADPEALFERIKKMASTQAVFDRKTGEARIDPMTLQFMKEQEKVLGMSPGSLIGSAKQQAKLNAIESDFRRFNPTAYAHASEEAKAAISNKAEYDKELGTWVVKYLDEKGEEQQADIKNLTEYQIQQITKDNIEPVEDIRKNVRRIAEELIGTQERMDSMKDQWKTGLSQLVSTPMKAFDSLLTTLNASGLWKTLTSGGGGTALALGGYGIWRYGVHRGKLAAARLEQALLKRYPPVGSPSGYNYQPTRFSFQEAPPSNPLTQELKTQPAKGGWVRWNSRGWSGVNKALKVGTVATAVMGGIATAISGWNEADAIKAREDYAIERAKSYYTDPRMAQRRNFTFTGNEIKQRQLGAANRQAKGHSSAIGEGIGEAGGAIAGATIGSFLGPVGMIVGGLIGGWLGGKAGKKVGRGMADHQTMDIVGEHLHSIEESNEEENIRRIVLPIESIDYNVALITRMMGSTTAAPARGNIYLDAEAAGELNTEIVTAEPQIIQNDIVNPIDTYSAGGSVYHPSGPLSLNVHGSIDLNLKGTTIGSFTEKDILDMILNSLPMRKAITEAVVREGTRNGIGGQANKDNAFTNRNALFGVNRGD